MISIIIRTRNEEDWIGHCLTAVFNQDIDSFEVIIVDNRSDDKTLDIAANYTIGKIVNIENYFPGKALNRGVEASQGDLLTFLSAHCVPRDKTWLKSLVENLEAEDVAGVYGRQVPMAFSSASDVRDLYITFGLDKRIQEKDYFFHNANSAIKRDVWDKIPFNETITNIEDRVWAKNATEAGYKLVYEPRAEVFHSHGIHQDQQPDRTNSTIKVLKQIEDFDDDQLLPETMKPGNMNVIAFIPVRTPLKSIDGLDPIGSLIDYLAPLDEVVDTFFLSNKSIMKPYNSIGQYKLLERPEELFKQDISLGEVLKWGLDQINSAGNYPDYVLYLNPEYVFRPNNLVQTLIYDACFKGLDSVFVGYEEYLNYWVYDDKADDYKSFGMSLSPRAEKNPFYRGLYGLGCLTKSRVIRKGHLVGNKNIGVIPIDDIKYTLRTTNEKMLPLIEKLLIRS